MGILYNAINNSNNTDNNSSKYLNATGFHKEKDQVQ